MFLQKMFKYVVLITFRNYDFQINTLFPTNQVDGLGNCFPFVLREIPTDSTGKISFSKAVEAGEVPSEKLNFLLTLKKKIFWLFYFIKLLIFKIIPFPRTKWT